MPAGSPIEAIAPATTKPVFLMPPAVAIPAPEPGLKRADFGLPDDKFIFYFSFDFRSYAEPQEPARHHRRVSPRLSAAATLRFAWCSRRSAPAGSPRSRDALNETVRGDPRILVIDQELARPRAIALVALADCFVSLHRSEGFGRGPAEAMLLGKPVITTDYSGTRDFATAETALLVGGRAGSRGPG